MKRFVVPIAAALTLGLVAAPTAQAGCDPVYDPGSGCPGKFVVPTDLPGGEAVVVGNWVRYSAEVGYPSYVKDTADDGLDVHLWVLYRAWGGDKYKERIASASGLGATTDVMWESLPGVQVEWLQVRVCLGPGEDNCSRWVG